MHRNLIITSTKQWFPRILNMDGVVDYPGKLNAKGIETRHGFVELKPGDFIIQYNTGLYEVRRLNCGIVKQ